MSANSEPEQGTPVDAKRRTWLAAERTWLAWWRTGVGAAAVSVGVGRLLPGLSGTKGWELKALGFGYGVLSVVLLVVGAVRQHKVANALRQGSYVPLSTPLVNGLTAAGIALALATVVVIAVGT